MGTNPWLTSPPDGESSTPGPAEPIAPVLTAPDEAEPVESWEGVRRPYAGPPAPERTDCLGRFDTATDDLWVVGTHGGSGETTVAEWTGGKAADHRWPILASGRSRVLLVARTSSGGMFSARAAAQEWVSSHAPVTVLGLLLVADAPGKLPRELRDEAKHLSGGLPRTWLLPWVPELRLSPEPAAVKPPLAARRVLSAVLNHVSTHKGAES